ncbi:MAG: methyltransferase domain-containing protein [Polyangiaceae bacterium]
MTRYGAHEAAPQEIGADAAKIKKNRLLEEIYRDFYARISSEIPPHEFPRTLELGSGGGFFKELAPHVTTSECVSVPGIERVLDACRIEEAFGEGELDAICALNVFHHLPDAAAFLRGASRVLRPGGKIVLVEPWFTPVGQLFHRVIHHEPFVDDPNFWGVVGEGRMTAANTRLPTSVFRDSDERFRREFPALRVVKREPFHKWLYLLSGGLKLNTHVPRPLARRLVTWDRRFSLGNELLGVFALVVVDRI